MVSYGYARVSTTGQNLLVQEARLLAAGCEELFSDKASGMRASRPGWDECRARLEPGDELVAVDISRLGRSLPNLLAMFEELDEQGITVTLLDQAISTGTREGQLMLRLMMVIAEYLRVLLLDRTAEGREAALAAGQKFGRPPAMSEAMVDRAAVLYNQGLTCTEIGAALGVSRKTVRRRLDERAM
jgi:DNA invertase Pin-like site-specific DNA recombinase